MAVFIIAKFSGSPEALKAAYDRASRSLEEQTGSAMPPGAIRHACGVGPRTRRFLFHLLLASWVPAACSSSTGPRGGPNEGPRQPASVVLDVSTISLTYVGQTITLTATVRDRNRVPMTVALTWTSSNQSVATVSGAGVVRAVAPGSATITASVAGVTSNPATVTVRMSEPVCGDGTRIVSLIVERELADGIRAPLNQFEEDLCGEGFTVHEQLYAFQTHVEVRGYLAGLHARSGNKLVGAILVGDLPRAYQRVTLVSSNPNIPSETQTVISYQYYADLDGTFAASGAGAAGSWTNPYDVHGGDHDWEIWVGVLPRYKGSTAATVAALNRYFAKNHAYRTGGDKPPRAFLQVTEHFTATTQAQHDEILARMRDGQYAWVPFSNAGNAQLYFDSPSGGLSIQQGYTALTQGVADFTVTNAHGFWGASGQLTIAWVESNPVTTIFYWSNGCAVGDLDRPDNFLSSIVYSPTSAVLVGKGTTNNSGGMGNNANGFYGANVATSLSAGRTFGEAILDHVNVPLLWPWSASREFHFATAIVLGDPTLRLR